MRGSPFTFSNFALGLNTYDSPYTLKQGEARDCLNVLSSPRGAIQKRPGSTVFAAGASGTFPNLGVTDSFTRANEDPLSNAGKWSVLKRFGNASIGRVLSNTYTTKFLNPQMPGELELKDSFKRANEFPLTETNWHSFFKTYGRNLRVREESAEMEEESLFGSGMYWSKEETANPAVSIDLLTTLTGTDLVEVFCSVNAGETQGYFVRAQPGKVKILKLEAAGLPTEKVEAAATWEAGDSIGIAVKEGVVGAFRKHAGVWTRITQFSDSAYNKGFCGLGINSHVAGVGPRVVNFSFYPEAENAPTRSGAYWNVAEQTNPAASVALSGTSIEGEVGIATSLNAAGTQGYEVTYEPASKLVHIYKATSETGRETLLTTSITLVGLDSLGISVRNGVVTAWKRSSITKIWTVIGSIVDATYNKGFSGIVIGGTGNANVTNFSVGEIGPAPAEALFTSLLPCNINGTQYLIAASGTRLYSITTAGKITEIKSGLEEGTRWSIVQAAVGAREVQGPVYLSNGVDPPQYWTGGEGGAALTKPWTSKPEGEFADITVFKPKYLTYHANRIFAGGLSGDESAVRFSGLAIVAGEGEKADPTSWPKENVVWFEKDNGNPITGLGTVGPYVVVFKNHQTWVIYNMDEGENRQISDTIGCISNRSIVETHIGTFFLTPDQGIYLTNGSTLKEVSRNVKPILQGTDSNKNRAAKQDELKNAAGGYLNGHYYLSYMAQDGSMKTLDYDTVLNSWWLHDLAGNQWVAWEPTTGDSSLYTVPNKAKAGVVKAFVPGVYQDSGANYVGARGFTAFWLSSWEPFWQYFMRHRFQQPQIRKRIRTLFVDGKGELTTIVFKKFGTAFEELKGVVELGDQATLVNPVDLGEPLGEAGVEYQPVRYYALGTSRIWSFGFGNKSANFFEVDSYAADLSFRKA